VTFSLNIDADALPDVMGSIGRASFATGVFDEVYFEKVPYNAFTGEAVSALSEVERVLRPGGRMTKSALP
jgi:hypothetical protein